LSRVAKRYAKALFELSVEEKRLSEVEADLRTITKMIEDSKEFKDLLPNPLIADQDKVKLILPLFEGNVQPVTLNFLALLGQKKRLSVLPDIIAQFSEIMLAYRNIVKAEVISAVKLSDGQVERIKKQMEELTGKNLLLNTRTEHSLIGGFIVKVQDIIIDNSIRHHLDKLRERWATS
jgi:F-type H+-transporting ATPase subunit delta